MEKICCIAREEARPGVLATPVRRAWAVRHRLSSYATERRPMAWAKAAGMPKR